MDNVIGLYRVQYKGDEIMVPVSDDGVLMLPDGKTITLTAEQFATVKQQVARWEQEQMGARPLTYDAGAVNDGASEAKAGPDATTDKQGRHQDARRAQKALKRLAKKAQRTANKDVRNRQKEPKGVPVLSVVLVIICTALLTLFVFGSILLYLVGTGAIAIAPRWNGLVIYDTSGQTQSGTAAQTSMDAWTQLQYNYDIRIGERA